MPGGMAERSTGLGFRESIPPSLATFVFALRSFAQFFVTGNVTERFAVSATGVWWPVGSALTLGLGIYHFCCGMADILKGVDVGVEVSSPSSVGRPAATPAQL